MSGERASVLFVCLGNICRSPLAEAAFRREADRIGLAVTVDSAGTGNWHVGHAPDVRAQSVARLNGVDIGSYRARQVGAEDFRRFTHIVALDAQNFADLKAIKPADGTAELSLLLDHAGRSGEGVTDPYHGDKTAFEAAWRDVAAGAKGLARDIASMSQPSG